MVNPGDYSHFNQNRGKLIFNTIKRRLSIISSDPVHDAKMAMLDLQMYQYLYLINNVKDIVFSRDWKVFFKIRNLHM